MTRLCGLLLATTLLAAAPQPAYRVIVNAQNPAATLERSFLAAAFFKKTTHWADGDAVRPVDLAADSPARRAFSEEVLGRSVEAVRNYWQQQIFSGRAVPPPELTDDEAVVRYVQKNPGAVGYVSAGTSAAGVRFVTVR